MLSSTQILADGGAGGSGTNGTGGLGGTDSSSGAGTAGEGSSVPATGTLYGGAGGGGGAGTTGGNGGQGASNDTGLGSGAGGAGGATAGASGGNGLNGVSSGAGGGGGGAHGYVGDDLPTGAVSGGKGGKGGDSRGGGGGGGAGGYGAVVNGSGLGGTITGNIAGGNGGGGGNGDDSNRGDKGAGGSGGLGLQFTGSGNDVVIDGTVSGGKGGSLGQGSGAPVPAGNGGTGIGLGDDNTVTINSSVIGGDGGNQTTLGSAGVVGAGGAGLIGENAHVTVTTSGSITGGSGGSGGPQANAITFTGGTNALTLETGATISGAVAGAGSDALQLNGSAADSLDTSGFTGFSSLGKSGVGTWTITGGGLTGDTTISDGTLAVDGSIGDAGATTTVTGGTLGGSGTVVGTVFVNAGGAIGPGNSIGILAVTGTTHFGVGSFYDVEVDDAGGTDHLDATDVEISGGTVRVAAAPGSYAVSTQYTIITATNAVTGEFDAVTSDLAFLTPELTYDPTNVYLTLVNRRIAFATAAQTYNQRNVASALQQFSAGDPLYDIVIFQSGAGARQAFDALSGEIYASTKTALVNQAFFVRNAILGRLRQGSYAGASGQPIAALGAGGPTPVALNATPPMDGRMALGAYDATDAPRVMPSSGNGLVFWTQGYGSWGQYDGNGNAATLTSSLGGFVTGVDAPIAPSWRAGLATGYTRTDLSVGARSSSSDVDSYLLSGYAGGMVGNVALRGGAAWTWNSIDATRNVIFPGFFETETASYDGDVGQLFGEIAYPLAYGDTAIEPFGGLAWVHMGTDSFTESGGSGALRAASSSDNVGFSTLGLRAAGTIPVNGMLVTPRASLAWQYAFGDTTPDLALAFASSGASFGILGVPLARNSAVIEAGLDMALGPQTSLGVSYVGQLASAIQENGVQARLDWRF